VRHTPACTSAICCCTLAMVLRRSKWLARRPSPSRPERFAGNHWSVRRRLARPSSEVARPVTYSQALFINSWASYQFIDLLAEHALWLDLFGGGVGIGPSMVQGHTKNLTSNLEVGIR
jgi:hypothetical protein